MRNSAFQILVLAGFALSPRGALAITAGEGLQYLDAGNFKEAAEVFTKLSGAEAAACPKCLLYLSIALYRGGDYAAARTTVETILSDVRQNSQAALGLGYGFLILTKQPDATWLSNCLDRIEGLRGTTAEDRLFLAQSALDASSFKDYGIPLRGRLADALIQTLDGMLVESPKTKGARNALGRAWVLKGEILAGTAGEYASVDEALDKARACFKGEIEIEDSAIYWHNYSVSTRLLAERRLKEFWTLRPMAASNDASVRLAKGALGLLEESLEHVKAAAKVSNATRYLDKIQRLQRTTESRLKNCKEDRNIRKVLGI